MKSEGIGSDLGHAGRPDPVRVQAPLVHAPLRAWAMVLFLSFLYLFSFLDRTVIAMMVDPIKHDLNLDDVQMGILVGIAFGITYSLMGLPMGWMVDRFPRRAVIFGGVALWSVAEFAGGFSEVFMHLFIARALLGVGEASLHPAAHSLISDAFPRHQLATAMSVYSMGASLGTGAALLIGGTVVDFLSRGPIPDLPLLGEVKAWQMVFMATGLPGLLLAVMIFLFPEPQRRLAAPGAKGERVGFLAFIWRNRLLWLCLTLSFGVMNIANGALIFWQPSYLGRFFKWSPADYGTALGLIQVVAGLTGMLFSGRVIDRMFERGVTDAHMRFFLWVLVLTTPPVIVALLVPNVWVYLGLIWIAKFATINFLGYATAVVMLTTPIELRGRMSALFTTVLLALLGQGLGPLVPALIAEHILHDTVRLGYAMALTIGACSLVASGAILVGLKPLRRAVEQANVLAGEHAAGSKDH